MPEHDVRRTNVMTSIEAMRNARRRALFLSALVLLACSPLTVVLAQTAAQAPTELARAARRRCGTHGRRPLDLGIVLVRPHRREDRDARPARLARSGSGRSSSTRRSSTCAPSAPMDRFEQTFWSGQSLEELYRTLSAQPGAFDGGAVRRGDARVEAHASRAEPRHSPACRCASRR